MIRPAPFVLLASIAAAVGVAAQVGAQTAWKQPPKHVVDVLDAPPTPRVAVDPTGTRALLIAHDAYPPLEMLARPFLKLAGHRIDPGLGGRQRTMRSRGIEVLDFEPLSRRVVALPKDVAINSVQWSHDGARFAFTHDAADGIEVWVGDAATGTARPLAGLRAVDILSGPFGWLPGGGALLVRAVPKGRGPAPAAPPVPAGPVVEETSGKVSKVMTFQDLLRNAHDEALFEHYATTQLVVVDVATGAATPLGKPGLHTNATLSPDGSHWLVTRLVRPFSYRVPSLRFAQKTEVWSRDGAPVRAIAELPVQDEVPPQGVATGPRGVEWQPLMPATLVWVEALDGGDPLRKVPHRDRLMTLAAPFDGEPREVTKVRHRYAGLRWSSRPNQGMLAEFDRDRRWSTTWWLDLGAPAFGKPLFDLSVNDAYGDPGNPVMDLREDGTRVMRQDGDSVYLAGEGATESGDRPFLDRLDVKTGKSERLWRCAESGYESFVDFAGAGAGRIVVRSESRTDPPNYFLVPLPAGERVRLTDFEDPAPELTKVRKELLRYKRKDGVPLSGTLYLPPDFKEGERLPLVVWAYPLEYSDAGTAGQVRGSTRTFTRILGDSPLFFLLNGYAVLHDATMPVIGDPETMNDTFVEQIVSSAQAAVDAAAGKGVADPARACVAGHSYGAFMTANLLAHSEVFAAGIARSGAYNRSLTPFGFQSERRSYWEATDVYTRLSPFTWAHRINEPLLVIHGDADNNPGTHTMQSERLYQAIRGNGGTARLVLLPHESHGYRARESVLHVIAEMFEWADRHVKNRKPPER
jgi:dipeptidyl aminopeptidase/acylaminoacyl peptidase